MTNQTVTVTIPATLYDHLKRLAESRNRTVQDEILDTLLAANTGAETLPAELTSAIEPLTFLTDRELWQAARSRFPVEDASALESLHHKRGREGLSQDEERETALLLGRYQRSILVRAKAAAILKQRGHDVSELLRAS